MPDTRIMEDELQQSVIMSEEEPGYDAANADDIAGMGVDGEEQYGEEDASGEDDDDVDLIDNATSNAPSDDHDSQSVDEEAEEDLEEDDGVDMDAEAEGDDEAVGAVKIKPGDESEEDMESEESEAASVMSDDSENEEEGEEDDDEDGAVWEDGNGVEEEGSEVGASNTCMFCKQDEDHDPSEDFEAFLACKGCGSNAHQQCAREEDAIDEQNHARRWRCPGCAGVDYDTEEEDADEAAVDEVDLDAEAHHLDGERPVSSRSDRLDIPKVARDLLPPQKGNVDPKSHSVFNELVLNEDPLDGSRMLRKRKTSSIDEPLEPLTLTSRKRGRNAPSDIASAQQSDADEDEGLSERTSRPRKLRLKVNKQPLVEVQKKSRTSMILKVTVKPEKLKEVVRKKRQYIRRAPYAPRTPRPAGPRVQAAPAPVPFIQTPFTTDSYTQPFYSFFDKDTDGTNGKPYGGVLTDAEADTSKTLPTEEDRQAFNQARQKAEDEWRARVLQMQTEADVTGTRKKKSGNHASQIECIEFGGWEIDTWYAAPYPAEYSMNRVLYICEFCLKYMNSDYVAWRHKLKCATKHPPGDEIYRHGSISVFEVDGRKNPAYCQNMCLLAKLFLGSKTLYYDVEPFLFYVLCEYDEHGYHFVGYFSKEKRPSSQNNVSCILTLPIHQRKGYGNLLIDFSYLLTKVEEKTGSPEKPLSDMGLVSYRNYWRLIICQYFIKIIDEGDPNKEGLSVRNISDDTGMTPDDVVSALEGLRALVRDPQTKTYAFRVDMEYCRQYVAKWESKKYVKLKPEALAWTPYVMGRSNAVNFDLGPISTVAPREEDEAKIREGPNSVGAETNPVLSKNPELETNGIAAVPEEGGLIPQPVSSIERAATSGDGEKENAGGDVEAGVKDEPQQDVDPDDPDAWKKKYHGIPVDRFQVFPALHGRRGGLGRRSASQQMTGTTSSAIRVPGSASRPRKAGARRSTGARPKPSSARRKSGGTGRGPGRWPKGTKKSDYGNAASGPGLPPGWVERQARMKAARDGQEVKLPRANGHADEDAEDEVMVSVGETNGEAAVTDGANGEDMDAEGEDE